jgi:hypothetical protein
MINVFLTTDCTCNQYRPRSVGTWGFCYEGDLKQLVPFNIGLEQNFTSFAHSILSEKSFQLSKLPQIEKLCNDFNSN